MEPKGFGVLDHPLSRMMTTSVCMGFEFQTAVIASEAKQSMRRRAR
jgi:hypothetical protein